MISHAFLYSFRAILSSPNKSTSGQLFFYKVILGNPKLLSSKSILIWPNKKYMKIDWRLNTFFDYSCLICLMYLISAWINLESILNHLILLKMWCTIWRQHQYEDSTVINVFMSIILQISCLPLVTTCICI